MTHTDREIDVPLRERPPLTHDDVSSNVTVDVPHRDVRERLSGYLDGSSSEQVGIREHLDRCAACRAFCNTLRRTVEVTRQLPTRTLSNDAKRHLLERIKGSAAAAPNGAGSPASDPRAG